ncbi:MULTISPECIES: AAA family ATPase [Stigmatella]|uniref:ATPase family associated with various cellular activities (AAA) n=2 Tax=Stigmatella TaxID=40 RepID=A0A1H8D6B3_STIAU|nr:MULTISPECIES: AAA family ATPase [Stigmatella]SEN02695.1 ATPase family associated with various cellular activities (AAA) [Stigmatella aurantiaca]SEU33371.1 ATPase family associated with various cellular activities (AAA) [Stigmatella erecta]
MPPAGHSDDNPFNLENPSILDIAPPEPKSLEETGLKMGLLSDIALKFLYYSGTGTGMAIAEELCLPWPGVIERVVDFVATEKLVDLRGGKGFGRASVEFVLTEKGREYARDALTRTTYVGPAPVPIEQYNALITSQTEENPVVSREDLLMGLSHLTVTEELLDKLGPAVNSSRSLFLYGPPGNGKTSLAEAISRMFGGEAFVPYCLEIDNQIIKVFDSLNHSPVPLEVGRDGAGRRQTFEMDHRWQLCRRPAVVVGGELTLETLDLIYSETARFYEAPFQVKANGGMLLIDDFGRQKVHPTDLLNRWIVPLEKRIDFLTLHTGKKFEIPFEQLLVFSTNLDPKELVDEAFLRRIKYKIEVKNPDEETFRDIFQRVCEAVGIPYVDQAITYLIEAYYKPRNMQMRACHPRDLVSLIKDAARYRQIPPALSKDLLDQACEVFLVDL